MKHTGLIALGMAVSAAGWIGCGSSTGNPFEIASEPLTTGQVYGNNLPARTVVLSYDDGPDEHTLPLARYLNQEGVKATFFVNGRRFCKTFDANGVCTTPQETRPCIGAPQAAVQNPKYYPESLLDELQALGHRIANHSQDHCHLPQQTNAENLIWELKATQDILDRHICDGVFLFRAPYGEWNGTVLGRLGANFNKLTGPVNWEIDGGDWECWRNGATPESCANKYLGILNGRGQRNGIFLMHDRPEFNVGAESPLLMAKILVPRLKQMGFGFATMDRALNITPQANNCPASPADGGGVDMGGSDGAMVEAGMNTGGSSGGSGGSSGSGGSAGGGSGGSSGSGGSAGGGSGGSSGSGGSGGTTTSGGSGGSGSGGSSSSGGAGGSSAGRGGSGSGTGGSNVAPMGSGKSGGCSVADGAPTGAPLPLAALAILGAVLGIRRRSSRSARQGFEEVRR
jgi:MYXO-CTERM domain-containing protein